MSDSEFLVNMRKYLPSAGEGLAAQLASKPLVMPCLLDAMKSAGEKSADAALRPRGSIPRAQMVMSHAHCRSDMIANVI